MKRVTLLVNKGAGSVAGPGAQAQLEELTQLGREVGLDARVRLVASADLVSAVDEALRAPLDAIVAAGGDGTISTVAGQLVDHDMPLGILPLGTLNHFAKDLQIPLAPKEALALIAHGHARPIDVGEVNGRIFINNSSIGGYPEAVRERDEQRTRMGRHKWVAMFLASLRVFRRYPLLDVRLHLDGESVACRTPFVFIGNNEYKMSFFTANARARLDEGRLWVYTARCHGRLCFLRLTWLFLWNRLEQDADFESRSVTELWVQTRHKTLRVANDGELLKLSCPLHYRSRAGAIKVIAPSPEETA